MHIRFLPALLLLTVPTLLISCGGSGGGGSANITPVVCPENTWTLPAALPSAFLVKPNSFAFQLQEVDPVAISEEGFDLYVIDPEAGRNEIPLNAADIAAADGQVLAYLSIGEAEDYRDYFQAAWLNGKRPSSAAPCWLGPTNPDWVGNYKVRYWHEDWQTATLARLDQFIDLGVDGVYLDVIDAWYYWSNENKETSDAEAALRMSQFVQRLAYHARVTRGKANFAIVPQNGEDLIIELSNSEKTAYLNAVSALGLEDIFYNETKRQKQDETTYRLDIINTEYVGVPVLLTDYVDNGQRANSSNITRINDFRYLALQAGFVPFVARTNRELDSLNIIPGVQPN